MIDKVLWTSTQQRYPHQYHSGSYAADEFEAFSTRLWCHCRSQSLLGHASADRNVRNHNKFSRPTEYLRESINSTAQENKTRRRNDCRLEDSANDERRAMTKQGREVW
jgi:hypothetical protein